MHCDKVCRWNRFCHVFYVVLAAPLSFLIGQTLHNLNPIWFICVSLILIAVSTAFFLLMDWLRGGRDE